ncbi:MAG: BA14K family protein [Pseudorhodoplanes sp.]|uniref:BA14K family protein n=1 Tax=Pseudorhodoplanes sp. TaxID=1934341 RepID=UPI003D0C655C
MPVSKLLTASLGFSALALAAVLAPPQASAAPAGTGLSSLGAVDTQLVQQVRWRGRYYRGGYGYRGYGYRGGNGGAVAAGVLGGLALGAVIAGAASAPPPPPVVYAPGYGARADWVAYCSSKYRSFNPATGLYLGYDGQYHPCQ